MREREELLKGMERFSWAARNPACLHMSDTMSLGNERLDKDGLHASLLWSGELRTKVNVNLFLLSTGTTC